MSTAMLVESLASRKMLWQSDAGSPLCEQRRQVAHVRPLPSPAVRSPGHSTARPRPQTGHLPQALCCRCAAPATHWGTITDSNNDNQRRRRQQQQEQQPGRPFEETLQQYCNQQGNENRTSTTTIDNMGRPASSHVDGASPGTIVPETSVGTHDFVSLNKLVVVPDLGSPVSHWDDSDMDLSSALNYPKTGLSDSAQCQQVADNQPVRTVQQSSPAASTAPAAVVDSAGVVAPEQPSLTSENCNQVVSDLQLSVNNSAASNTLANYCSLTGNNSQRDLYCLVRTLDQLAKCGFYYPQLTMPQAKKKLSRSPVGTFLLRDSSDPRFLQSLSIRTGRGTTSIRIGYGNGSFLLDCEDKAREHMPASDCVIGLVQKYVLQTANPSANNCVFLESNGRRDTPVRMTRPCIDSAQSLKHLARKTLNGLVLLAPRGGAEYLQKLPLNLRGYMGDYKYCV